MRIDTFWESICRLAGEDGSGEVKFEEAVRNSAVPESVASVEVHRMTQDGLIDSEGGRIRLTERGRRSCAETQHKIPD